MLGYRKGKRRKRKEKDAFDDDKKDLNNYEMIRKMIDIKLIEEKKLYNLTCTLVKQRLHLQMSIVRNYKHTG